jgi:hypothetical protein
VDFKRKRLGRVSGDKTMEGIFKNGKTKFLFDKMQVFSSQGE